MIRIVAGIAAPYDLDRMRQGTLTSRAAAAALTIAAASLLAVLVLPGRAAAEVVEAGSTSLELNRGLFRTLEREGVEVTKVGAGTVQGRVVTIPVEGGSIELSTGLGSVDHGGGFKFRSGKRVARLTQLGLDTAKRGLYAKLDGKRMRIATVPSLEFARAGFGDRIEIDRLRLTRATTAALNRKLDLDRSFLPSRAFAAVSSDFQPEAVRIASGAMQFSLDPGFVAKLKSLDVDPVQFETAVLGSNPPAFGAPLIQGQVHPGQNRSWGFIEGGIRIAKLGTPEPPESPGPIITFPVLTFINLGLSLESQKLTGFIHAHDAAGQFASGPTGSLATLDLSGATVQMDPATRTLSIANARATLEAPVANLINETFATPKGKAPVLATGDPLGTFSLTMQVG
jgi:hypothetical protein